MTKNQTLVQQVVSGLLFLAVLAMLGWLSTRHKLELDWTAGNRNTLTEASRKQLEAMPDPVKFLVFLYPRSEQRQAIESDFEKFRRVKPDIAVEFVDPSAQPQKVREYNISRAGEVVVEYQGRRENLSATTEQAVTTALQRLAYSGDRWIVFLEGHGERGIEDNDQQGYAQFAGLLRDKGLKVRALNLAQDRTIPDNTSALVIAGPTRQLLEGEARIVAEYVAKGGNLLWLADPENAPGMAPVAQALGIAWQNGTAILLESAALGLPPFVYITAHYPPNPVTKDFPENALFPLVRTLTYKTDAGYTVQPLLTTSDQAWLETGPLEGELQMDQAKGDVQGPLTIGVTLTRDAKVKVDDPGSESGAAKEETRPQRVAAIGDSDFLSNAYLGQLGNSLLGLNLAQWLASRDAQLNIDVPKAPDRDLVMPVWGLYSIYVGFAFLLPALLLGFGVARWAVRRRR